MSEAPILLPVHLDANINMLIFVQLGLSCRMLVSLTFRAALRCITNSHYDPLLTAGRNKNACEPSTYIRVHLLCSDHMLISLLDLL